MATTIASASVKIGPDLSEFKAELEAEVRASLASASAKVHVDADTAEAEGQLALFDTELDRVNGRTVTATVKVNSPDTQKAEQDISTLLTAVLGLGPALVPIGAALAGIGIGGAAAFGSVALGAGTALLAVQGVKTALKDFSTEAASPSAANLQKLNAQMAGLAPSAQSAVHLIEGQLIPDFDKLRNVAAQGLFTGVDVGVRSLLTDLPGVTGLVASLSSELGTLAIEATHALGGPEFRGFFTYLDSSAAPILDEFGHSIGNIVVGFAGLARGFAPVTNEIGEGLDSLTARFAAFGQNEASSGGFQNFIAYVEAEGPKVGQTIEVLAGSFSHILTAIAPLGSGTLALVRAFAEITASIPTAALTPLVAVISTGAIALKTYTLATKGAAAAQKLFTTSAEGGAAAINPLTLALVGAVAVYGYVESQQARYNADITAGKQAVDAYTQSLNVNYASAASVGKAQDALHGQYVKSADGLHALFDANSTNTDAILKALSAYKSYGAAAQTAGRAQDQITSNTKILATEFGLTTANVTKLASANKLNLSGSLDTASAKFGALYQAAAKTHNPLSAVAADEQIIGDKAATASAQVSAFSDIIDRLAGTQLAAKAATLAFKDDLANLTSALKASHGSLDSNTKAGRASAEALNAAASQAIATANAHAKLKGGVDGARRTLENEISALQHTAGGSKAAQGAIDLLRAALAKIPSTADDAANGMQSATGRIKTSATVSAQAAKNALQDAGSEARSAGISFADGFASGISAGQIKAIRQAESMGALSAQAAKNAIESSSPSKVMHRVGVDFVQGYADGITDSTNVAVNAATTTVKASADAAQKELTKQQKSLTADLNKAKSTLSGLRSSAGSVKSSALSGFQSLGDPSQFGSQTSLGQVLSILGKQTKFGGAFEANLTKDRREGLDKTAYNELLSGGAAQNSNIAALLAHATKAQIAEFNRDEEKLTREGRQTGRSSARYLYGKQIDAATKVVQRLEADQHDMNRITRDLAHDLKDIAKKGGGGITKGDIEKLERAIHQIGSNVASALNGAAHHAHTKNRARPAGARG